MHYLLGLAALVMGAVIATRRTRPTWFVVTTCVLVGFGALLAILSFLRVTDPMGFLANSILGWVFVAFSIMTMLSAVFVLERRGAHGEELPPLIGDNPFDGDTDDTDDPVPGAQAGRGAAEREAPERARPDREPGASAGFTAVAGAAAAAGAAGAVAAGSPGYAGVGAAGTESFADEVAGERAREGEPMTPEETAMTTHHDPNLRAGGDPAPGGDEATMPAGSAAMDAGLRASLGAGGGDPGAHTDERPAEREDDRGAASDPGPGADDLEETDER